MSFLRPRTWQKIHENKISIQSDFDMISIPAISIHSADQGPQFMAENGSIRLRIGIPQLSIDYKLEWHLALVLVIESCIGHPLTDKSPPKAPPRARVDSIDDIRKDTQSIFPLKSIEIEIDEIIGSLTATTATSVSANIAQIHVSVDVARPGTPAVKITGKSAVAKFNDHTMILVSDLDVCNVVKPGEIQRLQGLFSDTSNIFHGPIEGGSKSLWLVIIYIYI